MSEPSRFNVIALDQLQRMIVLEDIDSEVVIADRMARFRLLWSERDPPAFAQYDVGTLEFDPIKINQECGAFFEILLRDRVNQAARAVTLAFASGSDLDGVASRYPGGMPRLPGESDDRYRRRVWLSPNALSPHGTSEAYVLWALTADPTLRDATATSPEGTGEVVVTILPETEDMNPTLAQLLNVRAYIQEEDAGRKGLTDILTVRRPKIVQTDYRIRIALYPGPDKDSIMSEIRTNLEELVEAQRWLGYDHTHTAIQGVMAKGVHHADIIEPASNLLVDAHGVVHVNDIVLEYIGRTE